MIQRAKISDLAEIAVMEKEIFSTPWSEISLMDSYNSGRFAFFVAKKEERVVAYGGMYLVGDEGFVANIACAVPYRHRGYGHDITQRLIDYGREQKLYSLSLEVRVSNEGAIRLYRNLGFREIGIRKKFYVKPEENAMIMTYFY